jgi:hypothetical protein
MREGMAVVDACLRLVAVCKPVWWALENPVGKLKRYLGEPTMRFNPCDYGDSYTKKTCLWGDFVVPVPDSLLVTTRSVEPIEGSKMHLLPPSKDRQRIRSPPIVATQETIRRHALRGSQPVRRARTMTAQR